MLIIHTIVVLLVIALAPICSGQTGRETIPRTARDIDKYFGASSYPVRMTIKPSKRAFSRREPFVFEVTFTNTSKAPVFLNLVSAFSFRAYLSTIKKDSLYTTTYAMGFTPRGASAPSRREDYKEIPSGQSYTITVTSDEVVDLASIQVTGITHPSWEERRPGRLKLFLKYFSGRPEGVFFARQLEGSMNSNEIVLSVK